MPYKLCRERNGLYLAVSVGDNGQMVIVGSLSRVMCCLVTVVTLPCLNTEHHRDNVAYSR